MRVSLIPGLIFLTAIAACAKTSPVASGPSPARISSAPEEPGVRDLPGPDVEPSPARIPSVAEERALQTEAAVRTREAREQRLHDVSLPLLRHGRGLCGREVSDYGLRYQALEQIEDEAERDAYRKLFDVGERPTIIGVTRDGVAQRAGLAPGDVIVRVGGIDMPVGARGSGWIKFQLDRWLPGHPLPMVVRRRQEKVTLEITAEGVCDFPILLSRSDQINAWADGYKIGVNVGLLRFVESDEELQFVIAHEMAHNSIGHSEQDREYEMLRRIRGRVRDVAVAESGGVVPPGEFSQTQEREADYMGMYYLARAGIDTRGAARFWRRVAAEDAAGIPDRRDATHPAYPDRFVFLEKVHLEIARKKEAGEPLIPDRAPRRF